MEHPIRTYDPEQDFESVTRIWQEVGWVDQSTRQRDGLEAFLSACHTNVATIDGDAECSASWTEGTFRCQDTDLPMSLVAAITTSLIGRKLGLATNLTALALAESAQAGMSVAVLGIFDQGFYDRLGFGSGSYEHQLQFDPGTLQIGVPYRTPVRVGPDDWQEVSDCMRGRNRLHGAFSVTAPEIVQAELAWLDQPFGLGYRNDDGELTHVVMGQRDGADGPFRVRWLGYQTSGQLLELLRALRELADQVQMISMLEPPGLQLQDLLHQPIRERNRTRGAAMETRFSSLAWWQIRILDLATCVAARTWPGPSVSFNLTLTDPVERVLDDGWRGIGGDYRVTIGEASTATEGHIGELPHLHASVGAFSRLLFGVRPATSLAITDNLHGPAELLKTLDVAIGHPVPQGGWDL